MAYARKCDRCGKCYEVYNTRRDDENINGFIPVNVDGEGKYYSHGIKDLCPDCFKEFKKWLKK